MTVYSSDMLDHARFYRSLALDVDNDPGIIKNHFNHPSINQFLIDRDSTCLERTMQFECLSYGDAGVLLTAPGPSLAGQLVRELGDETQQAYFHDYITRHKARTFFAVTEPLRGSDAANLTTTITRNESGNYYLTGEKCLVGNGAVGEIGIVIAKKSPGPLGMVAVLITPKQQGTEASPHKSIQRKTIPTVGLRGASLSHLIFNHYEVKPEQILGTHLRIANRGLMGLMKTFNRMRTCVGALGIGLSQAVLDYVAETGVNFHDHECKLLSRLSSEVCTARAILYKAAQRIDADVTDSASASMAKVIATKTAEKVVNAVLDLFGPDVFWEHPLLEKWHRDVYGFEFMEGTMQVHYKNVTHRYLTDKKFISL